MANASLETGKCVVIGVQTTWELHTTEQEKNEGE